MWNQEATKFSTVIRKTAFIGLASTMLVTSGCSLLPVEEEPLKPPLVKPAEQKLDIVEVARGSIERQLRGVATFVSNQTEQLFFKESGGRIKTFHVKLGDEVEAGQLLVELETGDLETRIRLQKLSLERAEIEFMRVKTSGGGTSEVRLKEIDVERERIMLASLEEQRERSILVAPFDGMITYLSDLSAGDNVSAYQNLLSLSDPDQIQLLYEGSNANDLSAVQVNMPVKITFKSKEYSGNVLQSPSSAPFTGNNDLDSRNARRIIVGMDELPEGSEIGNSAEILISIEKRDDIIVIPRRGLRTYLGRNYVQVQEDERRKEVDVEVGLTGPLEVEIVRGLDIGQKVILNN
ncbi:efflux RND transporter periplasmic adaptor subunit [Paenibacillus tarimensis]